MPTTIGFFLFDGVEELDWAGPWEVLASWATRWPDDGVHCFTMSQTGAAVRCARGARVLVDHSWDDAPVADVLVYPGGIGTRPQVDDEAVLAWVRTAAANAQVVASVCTGALVLGSAGLLDDRPATTHWRAVDELRGLGRRIEVRAGERFVDDGNIVTSAGISAGIDMALHLVARLHSVERAREVRHQMQYDPKPPV